MSIAKLINSWKGVLKLTVLRRGPRPYLSKPTVPKVCKSENSQNHHNHKLWDHPTFPKFTTTFLKSVLSRTSRLFKKHTISPLHPRYAGRIKRIPVFSLLGLCLATDFLKPNDNKKHHIESKMTDTYLRNVFKDYKWEPNCLEIKPQNLNDLVINERSVIGNGCEGAVFEAKLKTSGNDAEVESESNGQEFDLAIKAVFNYYAESNASSILRKLYKEIVPLHTSESDSREITEIIDASVPRLPPHPNVVDMYCAFVDDMLVTEEGQRKFSAAMPQRVNPETCFARNKTLHLVMKKCATELSDYLLSHKPSMKTRCSLLMQLLEAVCHMSSHGVAHRDIKADNLLISLSVAGGSPHLQVCDFGCCLAEADRRLEIPYVSSDTNIGGNSCLMAPEISCAKPGKNSILDFRKSDLWACGALAYQILGSSNPFYRNAGKQLKSQTYSEEDLPSLPDDVPDAVKRLVRSLLARDPAERPSAAVAVLVVQLVIWDKVIPRQPTPSGHLFKRRQDMEIVWDEMVHLIRRIGSKSSSNDMAEISKYFCLSRLTYCDIVEAFEFFP